jgi:TPR repeat protein
MERWYVKATADQGHGKVQFNLEAMHAEGQGEAQSAKKSLRWYRKATEQGNYGAQNCNLKTTYVEGMVQSDTKALRWWV